jgi:hypothetical protein
MRVHAQYAHMPEVATLDCKQLCASIAVTYIMQLEGFMHHAHNGEIETVSMVLRDQKNTYSFA